MRLPIAISDRPPRGANQGWGYITGTYPVKCGGEVMVLNRLVEPLDWKHPIRMKGAAPSGSETIAMNLWQCP
jgi:hypothetical protein